MLAADERAEIEALRAEVRELRAQLAEKPPISRSDLHAIVDQVPWAVLSIDDAGQVIYANPAMEAWLVLGRGAAGGEPWRAVVTPELAAELAEDVTAALAGRSESARRTARVSDRTGALRRVASLVAARHGNGGGPAGAVLALFDVTGVEEKDALLARAREMMDLALEGTGVGVYDMDLDTGEGMWSPSAFDLLGLTPGSAPATLALWWGRVHPDDRQALEIAHAQAAETGGPWSIAYRVVRADDGRERWLSVHGRFVHRPGQGVRSVGAVVDVTDQKLAESQAAERERFLAQISSVTPSLIHLHDVRTGRLTWVGGRVEDYIGWTAEEALAQGPGFALSLIHPEDRTVVARWRSQLLRLQDGEVVETVARLRHRNGGYRWVVDRTVVFQRDETGRVTQTLSASIDITDRKLAADQQQMLINELNHRVKNTLATVQSIARQTFRRDEASRGVSDTFTARLMALSSAHDVLTRENWQGATLREVALGALNPFDWAGGRIHVHGNYARLPPAAAVGLAMALHELATNAAKYGALSNDVGEIVLRWESRRTAHGHKLELEWREIGGPEPKPRTRTGFGSRLLEKGVPGELGGEASVELTPTGAVYRLRCPLP